MPLAHLSLSLSKLCVCCVCCSFWAIDWAIFGHQRGFSSLLSLSLISPPRESSSLMPPDFYGMRAVSWTEKGFDIIV